MGPKKRQILDLWYEYRLGIRAADAVPEEPEPWVCPGWSPIPESKSRSTVLDFIYDPVYSEEEAALELGESPEVLTKWRQRCRGPAYIQYGKHGVVRYSRSALNAYLNLPYNLSIPDKDPSFDGWDAAEILGVEAETLKKWRQKNRGPGFFRRGGSGAVRYRLSDLMKYRAACIVANQEPWACSEHHKGFTL